ncbi:MAG: hypothetical protein AAF230_09420 [Pseudomonadota bacterium]
MSNDVDEKVKRALQAIPEDADVSARLVAKLAGKRRPIGGAWLIGGAVVAGVAGFAVAFLQGPVDAGAQDAVLFFLGGAL